MFVFDILKPRKRRPAASQIHASETAPSGIQKSVVALFCQTCLVGWWAIGAGLTSPEFEKLVYYQFCLLNWVST